MKSKNVAKMWGGGDGYSYKDNIRGIKIPNGLSNL